MAAQEERYVSKKDSHMHGRVVSPPLGPKKVANQVNMLGHFNHKLRVKYCSEFKYIPSSLLNPPFARQVDGLKKNEKRQSNNSNQWQQEGMQVFYTRRMHP